MSEFADKVRSLGVLSRGRTRDHVREGRDERTGESFKATTDQLGNTVTERSRRLSGVTDAQDVEIRAPRIRVTGTTTEER